MGIYDRDYSRSERGFSLGGDRSMVANLILITIGAYIAQLIVDERGPGTQRLTSFLALHSDLFSFELLTHPWRIFSLVTYGFAHARENILHVLFNMFFFWFFGRDIENHYGRRQFLSIYLTTIVVAGLVWMLITNLAGKAPTPLIGASGGVAGVMILFVMHFPRRVVYIWGILPVPVWALGAFWLIGDVVGAFSRTDNVAYAAHLAGAAYGFVYFRTGWSFLSLQPGGGRFSIPKFRKTKLKVHEPEEYEDAMSAEVDQILAKIQEQGQDSLTAKERRTLERASRRYQQKHR